MNAKDLNRCWSNKISVVATVRNSVYLRCSACVRFFKMTQMIVQKTG